MRQRRSGSRTVLSSWSRAPRPLLVLDDGGPPLSVPPTIFGLTGRDRSWNAQAENFVAANREPLQALEVTVDFSPSREGLQLRLRSGGTVGAVPLVAPDTRKIAGEVSGPPLVGWHPSGRPGTDLP